jgi:hypothetical protein
VNNMFITCEPTKNIPAPSLNVARKINLLFSVNIKYVEVKRVEHGWRENGIAANAALPASGEIFWEKGDANCRIK